MESRYYQIPQEREVDAGGDWEDPRAESNRRTVRRKKKKEDPEKIERMNVALRIAVFALVMVTALMGLIYIITVYFKPRMAQKTQLEPYEVKVDGTLSEEQRERVERLNAVTREVAKNEIERSPMLSETYIDEISPHISWEIKTFGSFDIPNVQNHSESECVPEGNNPGNVPDGVDGWGSRIMSNQGDELFRRIIALAVDKRNQTIETVNDRFAIRS
jgi:hypothetical protein